MTRRIRMPDRSSFFSRDVKTFGDTPGMSAINSLNRLGSDRRYQIMFGVQAPPKSCIHIVTEHSFGGGGTLLFRRLIAMGSSSS